MKKIMAFLPVVLLMLALSACAGAEDQVVEVAAAGFSGSERPSGEMPSGEMPSGGMPSGEMPSGEMPSGEMPSGFSGGELPSGEMPSGGKSDGEKSGGEAAAVNVASTVTGRVDSIVGNEVSLTLGEYGDGGFSESGESAVYLLPVGMRIGSGDFSSVSAGAVLTLSFNEAGDIVAASLRG